MLVNQRILWNDNGTEKDLSKSLNDFRGQTEVIGFVSADDYIYLASDMPFNHRYFDVAVVNDQTAAPTVDIWYAQAWESAVDIIDHTSVSDVTMAQSGILQWKTDDDKGWDREADSEEVTGVDIVGLYDMYWVRIGFDADLAGTFALNYLGHRFVEADSVLDDYYPDLNKTGFLAGFGVSDWTNQHFMAAEDIIRDLRKAGIITSPSQLLDWEKFEEAAVHKLAEIAYRGMGRHYREPKQDAQRDYARAFKQLNFNVDLNKNANLDRAERVHQSGYFGR